MSPSTKADGDEPSKYVTIYMPRKQAEEMERYISEGPAKRQWSSGLHSLRKALENQSDARRYPWQDKET